MSYSRRDAVRLIGGVAVLPLLHMAEPGLVDAAEPEATDAGACIRARAHRAADYLTVDEIRWLEDNRMPASAEGVEDLGCVVLDDETVGRRRRRSIP